MGARCEPKKPAVLCYCSIPTSLINERPDDMPVENYQLCSRLGPKHHRSANDIDWGLFQSQSWWDCPSPANRAHTAQAAAVMDAIAPRAVGNHSAVGAVELESEEGWEVAPTPVPGLMAPLTTSE